MSELLFYGGAVLCGASAIMAVIAAIVLNITKNRLNKKLDAEYGKRRR